jgi:hypothetical protein
LAEVAGFDPSCRTGEQNFILGTVQESVFADPAGGRRADFCAGVRAPFVRDNRSWVDGSLPADRSGLRQFALDSSAAPANKSLRLVKPKPNL